VKVFIDTSVFVRHYYGSDSAVRLLDRIINEEDGVISPNVIEETFFKLLYMETERLFGKTGKFTLKDKFRKDSGELLIFRRYLDEFIFGCLELDIIELLIPNPEIMRLSVEVAFRYKLLPNDALIAATCKYSA